MEFLEYFGANPGLSFEEIKEVDVVAYKRLDGSYWAVIQALPPVLVPELGPTVPLERPVESVLELEKRGAKASKQVATTPPTTLETKALMKEVKILTGRSRDPENI